MIAEVEKQLRQEWETPNDFFFEVAKRWWITVDVCASHDNKKCEKYISADTDSLAVSWGQGECCWCNPGYRNVQPWLEKAFEEVANHNTTLVLTHAGIAARWFRPALENCYKVFLLSPRINFIPPKGIKKSSNTRDSVLWVFSKASGAHQKIEYWKWK